MLLRIILVGQEKQRETGRMLPTGRSVERAILHVHPLEIELAELSLIFRVHISHSATHAVISRCEVTSGEQRGKMVTGRGEATRWRSVVPLLKHRCWTLGGAGRLAVLPGTVATSPLLLLPD